MKTDQKKKKGNYSKLVYPTWAYRILKTDKLLFLEIGRNQIKQSHGYTKVYCSNADQQERVISMLGEGIPTNVINPKLGGKQLVSC